MSARVILSPARAEAILEDVAARFGVSTTQLRSGRRSAGLRPARAEAAWRLKADLNWSQRRTAALLCCGKSTVFDLLAERARLIASFQERVERDHRVFMQSPEALELVELREKLARLTGADLANDLVRDFRLAPRCAIVMGMLAEAYPRPLAMEAMCELYDDACQRLDYGYKGGANRELIRKNVSDLNRALLRGQFPLAAEIAPANQGRRLSDKMAALLAQSYGIPRPSRLMAAKEARVR